MKIKTIKQEPKYLVELSAKEYNTLALYMGKGCLKGDLEIGMTEDQSDVISNIHATMCYHKEM